MKWVCWSEVYIIPENLLSKDENLCGRVREKISSISLVGNGWFYVGSEP